MAHTVANCGAFKKALFAFFCRLCCIVGDAQTGKDAARDGEIKSICKRQSKKRL